MNGALPASPEAARSGGLPPWQRFLERLGDLLVDHETPRDLVDHGRVGYYTLALTRWIAIIGQLFTILFVHFSLGIELPLLHLLPAVALSVALNVVLGLSLGWATRLSEPAAGGLFTFDLLQLGWLLWFTGGIQNPFSVLLLVPVALAAGLLGRLWTVLLTGLAVLVVTLLALHSGGMPWHEGTLELPELYRVAAWAALTIATVLVSVYAWQFAEEARQRAAALAATQMELMREQQLSALGGQAAAAAHMLGSPLATINVVAKELVRSLSPQHPLYEDAQEILSQVERCRDILASLGRGAADRELSRFTRRPFAVVLREIAEEWGREGITVEIHVSSADGTPEPEVSLAPELRHALANLIENAISFARSRVDITLTLAASGTTLEIVDDGPGFSPEVLDWLGEPYVSTRRAQGGMGLGVFIANTLLARTGARLQFDNTRRGARVRLYWPGDALQRAVEEKDHEPADA